MKIPLILLLSSNRVGRTYPGGMKLDLMEGCEHPVDAHFPEDLPSQTGSAHFE
jgi:hypothetical protein